jgi:uncharacterized protein
MIIVWDEPKRLANLDKHGIDFADIGEAFFLTALVRPAKQGRYAAIGYLDAVVVVIFATLGKEGIAIISARSASRKERDLLP